MRGRMLDASLCAGLVLVVVGTFLPWLTSGSVRRSSYSAGDALRRAGELPTGAGTLLDVWPFVPLLCALAAALALLGRRGPGSALAVIAAGAAGSVAGVVLAAGSGSLVRPTSTGPAVTLAGAALILATVVVAITGGNSGVRRPAWSQRDSRSDRDAS